MLLSERLDILLDSTFIHFSADCFQWAVDSEVELNSLDEKHRKEVLSYHRGDDYKSKATRLVNQEYHESLSKHKLAPIELHDLERSWHIVNRVLPKDPLGMIYSWFTSHAALYIPDRFGEVIRPLEADTRDKALLLLFKDFMKWAEQNNHLSRLSFKAGEAAYIDEVEGIFKLTVKVLTVKNSYLQQIFTKFAPIRSTAVPTQDITLNKDQASEG
jgi:hypothetical protein